MFLVSGSELLRGVFGDEGCEGSRGGLPGDYILFPSKHITAKESPIRIESRPKRRTEKKREILTAAPNGFAKLATAVAPIRPCSVNHISLYRVGAASTNGCASPVTICPTITTAKLPPFAIVPAYRIQFPTNSRPEAASKAGLGPRCSR